MISDANRLELYNGALLRLGSRRLASLTENREPRRVMDDVWGGNDAVVIYALSRGEWNFALRTVLVDYTPSVTPAFGFLRAFEKPVDCVRIAGISADEYMRTPLTNAQYLDEAGYWFADIDVLYARFVSSGDTYGLDVSRWPQAFRNYLELYMAWRASERLTNSTSQRDRLQRDAMMALKETRSGDAMAEGVKFMPRGGWSGSRGNARSER